MLSRFKALVLRIAKVPAEPHAPAGSPGSIRVFRAAPNFWKYLLVVWGVKQVVGLVAIWFFLSLTAAWQAAARDVKTPDPKTASARKVRGVGEAIRWHRRLADGVHALEVIGVGLFLVQVPLSLAKARLDYEMRWYIVTDRSMRLRDGVFGVREMTLTFANVQNIAIRQGPLQRLLGIADVVVRTAGGGSDQHQPSGGHGKPMHVGTLRAVDNAEQVRDLILDRLRRLRDAGLGDPDDRHHHETPGPSGGIEMLRAAAQEVLDAARALRQPSA